MANLKERWKDYFYLAILMIVFYSLFEFKFAFFDSHVSGGDMISHPHVVSLLKEQWSQGRLWGWSDSWLGGIPTLYFYFYPIYVLALFYQLIGFSDPVAFKLMVLTVVSSVPFFSFVFLRKILNEEASLFVSSLIVAVFLNELESRWGGNFKSLLAGQMSHQLGLVAMTGVAVCSLKKEFNSLSFIFLYSLSILAHVYTALFASLIVFCLLLLEKEKIKNAIGPTLAVLFTSFFWMPFLFYKKHTVMPLNSTEVGVTEVLRVLQVKSPLYILIYASTILMIFLFRKNKQGMMLLGLAILTTFSLPFLKGTPFLHIRLPAEIYVLSVLSLASSLTFVQWHWQRYVFLALSVLILQSVVPSSALDRLPKIVRQPVRDLPAWWKWNMEGIEKKPNIIDVQTVWQFLKGIDDNEGRVSSEYDNYNVYGSPRIFEMTSEITGRAGFEGLLLESSVLYPLYYYTNMYFNSDTWWPGFKIERPQFDVAQGVEFLKALNIKYFITRRETTKSELAALGLKPIYENQTFHVHKTSEDLKIANRLEGEMPLIQTRAPLLDIVQSLPGSIRTHFEVQQGPVEGDFSQRVEQTLVPLEGGWSEDKQSYRVTNTGASAESPVNVLFKIAYFPNWKTNTGEAVRLVSPGFMVVTTTSPTLVLEYRVGWVEKLAMTLSVLSVFMIFFLKIRTFRKGHRLWHK